MSAPQTRYETICTPQIKICGITAPEDALACASLGADAIGLVFYPRSPRYVDIRKAADICSALSDAIARVGVFVDADFDTIMEKINACGLTAVQLHGNETPELVEQLSDAGVKAIKALYINKKPGLDAAPLYPAAAFLVECAGGALPGGNAVCWDWGSARAFAEERPMILAGGLSPDNVAEAIRAAAPDAIDVSSGVEAAPGRKDIQKIKTFIQAVRACQTNRSPRRVL